MKKALRTIWSYILAFTVDLKKTARAINEEIGESHNE